MGLGLNLSELLFSQPGLRDTTVGSGIRALHKYVLPHLRGERRQFRALEVERLTSISTISFGKAQRFDAVMQVA